MKSHKIIFRKNPVYGKCPSCSEENVIKRSRSRNNFEKLLKLTSFFKTYRCAKCGWRGNLPTFVVTSDSLKNLLFYLSLALRSAFLVYQLLHRFVKA